TSKLNKLIGDRLLGPVQNYIGWLNTAVHCWKITPPDISALSANGVWGLTPAMLAAYEEGFSCTVKSTRSQLLEVQAELSGVVNAFADVVDLTVDGISDLVNDQLYSLLQNNGQADTPPQLAVLYAFLVQFQKVLNDLNGLTQKQLNFFFQQVLQLSPGPSIPDEAYVVFSIQKQLPAYTVDAGTSLKASGKDGKGADIYFQVNEDVPVNQTQVAALQTVFVNKQPWGGNSYVEGVYMAPNAMMADGVSKPFADPTTAAWPTLGAKQSLYTPPGASAVIDYPYARLGFILASKVFYLKEGKRKIDIQLVCQWSQDQSGGCMDGIGFEDVFPLAKQSICARFAVLTPDILAQAKQQGVSGDTITAMEQKYLLDTCTNPNPCDGAPPVYLDKHLFWVPCCSVPNEKKEPIEPGMKPEAGGELEEARIANAPREEAKGKRVKAFGLEGAEHPVHLDVSQRCPDEWEEVYCNRSAQLALRNELASVAGKGSQDVAILEKLLVLKSLFDVEFSGEKGWQAPDYLDMELEPLTAGSGGAAADSGGVQQFIWHIRATIDTPSPGIVFYDKTKLGEDFHVTDPLVKIVLNNDITWSVDGEAAPAPASCLGEPVAACGEQLSPYEFFRNVTLLAQTGNPNSPHKTKIDVMVCGVRTLVVQNDSNLMDVNKAFAPFGTKPLIPDFLPVPTTQHHAHLGRVDGPNFLIGSTEVFLKKWTELYLNMSWLSKPDSFTEYYRGYLSNEEFHWGGLDLDDNYTVNMAILENGLWHPRRQENNPLFPGPSRSFPVCCNNRFDDTFYLKSDDFEDPVSMYDPDFAVITKWVAGMQRGFLRFTLEQQDFLHRYYPLVMGKSMRHPEDYPNVINEPWTPTIIPGMSIDYRARASVDDMTLVQLYPFAGTSNIVNIYGSPTLLHKFCDEGNLFIGLTGLVPGQLLNLLFQLAEASAGAGSPEDAPVWQYLAGDEWKTLRYGFEIVADGTKGLTRTGIIQIKFPDDIANTSNLLAPGNSWISAGMTKNTAAVSRTMAVITQAGLATYAPVSGVNDPARSATALPADTISKLTQPDANIIKIGQPYPSFGGSAPENSGNAYMVRVSEGLRHKGRAIQQWDFERLVLQQFPMLLRVKCINHSLYLDSAAYKYDFPMSPGNILVAVLPDTTQLAVANQLQPMAPASMLNDILQFLQGVKSPFATIAVAGPRYEPVTICATVQLEQGEDPDSRSAQLEQAIRDYLAPWLGEDMDQFQFAQPLYFADVANLIQSQEYVAYLTRLTMSHAGEQASTANPAGFIAPRTPRSILVAGTVFVNAVQALMKPLSTATSPQE
ncbi:MAG TPA: hypothetical protein VNU70_05225, partial [Puia sp.]|nr:hypothetical protein [Puia sp.]